MTNAAEQRWWTVGHAGEGHASSIRREDCPQCSPNPEHPAPGVEGVLEPMSPTELAELRLCLSPNATSRVESILNREGIARLLATVDDLASSLRAALARAEKAERASEWALSAKRTLAIINRQHAARSARGGQG